MPNTDHIYTDVESRLGGSHPEVELLACEPIGADRLRVVIDHPEGVSLALCEQVTHELGDLLEEWGLEVASPGPERPLTKPEHFRRFIGRRARVRTREPREGHKSFTGELVGATEDEVALAAEAGVVTIPYTEIARSNLVKDSAGMRNPSSRHQDSAGMRNPSSPHQDSAGMRNPSSRHQDHQESAGTPNPSRPHRGKG